jgi:hypothetical protein
MLEKGDGIMATYVDAVEGFRESATAFIQQLSLLVQARDAYQQAMTASAELRSVLDAGDENLRPSCRSWSKPSTSTSASLPSIKRNRNRQVGGYQANGEGSVVVRKFP